ncbi:hypothetical protein [Caldiplasma sukawensis]
MRPKMNTTKIFLKLTVLLGLILILAYMYRVQEHIPAIMIPAYQTMINFLELLLLLGIIVTVAFTVIDFYDIDDRFEIKRL